MYTPERYEHDKKQERALIKRLGAPPKRCYYTSIRVTAHLKSGYYVEGFVKDFSLGGLVYEHAWHETPDGKVIDTTLVARGNIQSIIYCPVYRFEYAELRAAGIIKPRSRYTKFGLLNESTSYWAWAYPNEDAVVMAKEARNKYHVVGLDLMEFEHSFSYTDIRTLSDKE